MLSFSFLLVNELAPTHLFQLKYRHECYMCIGFGCEGSQDLLSPCPCQRKLQKRHQLHWRTFCFLWISKRKVISLDFSKSSSFVTTNSSKNLNFYQWSWSFIDYPLLFLNFFKIYSSLFLMTQHANLQYILSLIFNDIYCLASKTEPIVFQTIISLAIPPHRRRMHWSNTNRFGSLVGNKEGTAIKDFISK